MAVRSLKRDWRQVCAVVATHGGNNPSGLSLLSDDDMDDAPSSNAASSTTATDPSSAVMTNNTAASGSTVGASSEFTDPDIDPELDAAPIASRGRRSRGPSWDECGLFDEKVVRFTICSWNNRKIYGFFS